MSNQLQGILEDTRRHHEAAHPNGALTQADRPPPEAVRLRLRDSSSTDPKDAS